MCTSRCAVDITIQRLTHTHRRRSLRIVLKWCAVAASILRVFISNGSLLQSTHGHISPGRALQGAKLVCNNYIHGHFIINYHSSAVQECLGAERNGVYIGYVPDPSSRPMTSVRKKLREEAVWLRETRHQPVVDTNPL